MTVADHKVELLDKLEEYLNEGRSVKRKVDGVFGAIVYIQEDGIHGTNAFLITRRGRLESDDGAKSLEILNKAMKDNVSED